jgi:hypothetical protein
MRTNQVISHNSGVFRRFSGCCPQRFPGPEDSAGCLRQRVPSAPGCPFGIRGYTDSPPLPGSGFIAAELFLIKRTESLFPGFFTAFSGSFDQFSFAA